MQVLYREQTKVAKNKVKENMTNEIIYRSCRVRNDHIEDSAELFIALFLYNLLIYTLFLRNTYGFN